MKRPSERKARNIRRWVFWTWTAITVVVAVYIGVLAPVAPFLNIEKTWIAIIVPPVMILLVGIALAWLILYVLIPPRRDGSDTSDVAPRPSREGRGRE